MTEAITEELLSIGTRVVKGESTHVDFSNDDIRYKIDRKCYSQLFQVYMKEVQNSREAQRLGEVPGQVVPVIVAFNNLCNFDDPDIDYDDFFISTMSRTIQESVKCLGSKTPVFNNIQLSCCILERTTQTEDGKYPIDILFQFPLAVSDIGTIRDVLYPDIIDKLSNMNLNVNGKTIQNYEESLETKYYNNSIPMYGSVIEKNECTFRYLCCRPYTTHYEENEEGYNLLEIFPIENSPYYIEGIITQNMVDDERAVTMEEQEEFWLPVLLSISAYKSKTEKVKQKSLPIFKFNISGFTRTGREFENDKEDFLDMAKMFIEMWDPIRIYNKIEWLCIGEALYNIVDRDQKGCDLWKEITEELLSKMDKIPDFYKGNVDILYTKYYYSFPQGRITIKTLAENAKSDNPYRYEEWNWKWQKSSLEDALSCSHTNVARAIYRKYWLDYICEIVTDKKTIWYKKSCHKLTRIKGAVSLRKELADNFINVFYKMRTQIASEIERCRSSEKDKGEKILADIGKLCTQLKDNRCKKTFIDEASIYFNHPGLHELFDENPELTCVNSGVLIATQSGISIRPGRLEDYITKSTAAVYLKSLSWDDPVVKEIMEWSNQTFLRRGDMIRYWWKFQASFLRGGNIDKIFPIYHGPRGNEGKSVWVRLMEYTLGELTSKVDINYFTMEDKNPNGATPVTASLQGVRVVYTEESEDTRPLLAGKIKKRTGMDRVRARKLGMDGGIMTLQCTFVNVTNDIPPMSNNGSAMKERLRVIPFIPIRSNDAPDDIEDQYKQKKFKRNYLFDKDIEYMGAAHLWIMVQFYNPYIKEGLKDIPEMVIKHTERYWQEKDKYYKFTNEMFDVSEKEEDRVHIVDVYDSFKDWHERSYPKKGIPNRDEIQRELCVRWGKCYKQEWRYIKMKDIKPKYTPHSMPYNPDKLKLEVDQPGHYIATFD